MVGKMGCCDAKKRFQGKQQGRGRSVWVALIAIWFGVLVSGQGRAAYFEAKIALLDSAVLASDGVVFTLKVLDAQGRLVDTPLEQFFADAGFWVVRRDLSKFAGRDVYLQLEVSPGPQGNPNSDWAVWYRPVVKGADGTVDLDLRKGLHEATVGYVVKTQETMVGEGAQFNPAGGKDHGLCVWAGESLPSQYEKLNEAVFKVKGHRVLTDVVFMQPIWDGAKGSVFARYRLRVPANEKPVTDRTGREFELRGFLGEIDQVWLVPPSSKVERLFKSYPSQDVDLVGIARGAMHYLINNPSKERNYETRFAINPLAYPPSRRPNEEDLVAEGDTENRMDLEFTFMREMTGNEEGKEVEAAIRKRILGYIREDGLSWSSPYPLGPREGDPHKPCAMNWTTSLTLLTLLERYERDGNQQHLKQARRLFQGLRSLATWDGGRAYYEGGLSCWRDGRWLLTECSPHYPSILAAVASYWEVTRDPEALAFARAFADGQLADLQPGTGDYRFRPEGTYGGSNCHLHMRAVLGVAQLGALIGDPRYVAWARSVYEFTRSMGLDWGWFPEGPWDGNSETCATGDMVDVARWLARAGYTEYWDHVERYMRNYVSQAQFFMTPEFENLYREVHKDKPATEVEAGLELMRRYEGGFIARVYPTDLAKSRDAGGMNMMGCCPPEGMHAVYIAWTNTVVETKRGVEVNLALNRDHPAARVVSFLPKEGRVIVQARKSADFYLRPPAWTPRKAVQAYINGKAMEPLWCGDYVKISKVQPGQELTLTYPLVEFSQRVKIAGRTYTYHWLGNTVLGVEPRGTILPLFTEVPRPLPKIRK